MTVLTEKHHTGEFVISEANGNRSRENVTILSGEVLEAGTVLGKITSGGKYVAFDSGNGNGSEVANAILLGAVDASAGDTEAAVIARDAEVNGAALVYKAQSPPDDITDARAGLLANGIVVR